MNAPSEKTWAYILGAVVLCLLILLGWFAFHQEPPPRAQQTAEIEVAKPQAHRDTTEFEPEDDSTNEQMATQPDNSTITNAADLYRQAFALYDALTNDEKEILRDWRTNVDASVEAELCEKIRPICDLMHQASAMTNCDWGFGQLSTDDIRTVLKSLTSSRGVARAAIWNAARCRSNDVSGAVDDTASVLDLGRRVSGTAMIGHLVGIALQQLASSYVAQNLGKFQGADAQQLTAGFNQPSYAELAGRAMENEAGMQDRWIQALATNQPAEVEKKFSETAEIVGGLPTNLDEASILTGLKRCTDSERELAKALVSSSEDDYSTWRQHAVEIEASNPFTKLILEPIESFLDRVQAAEVNQALVVAGIAVAQQGADALQSKPDPSSGQPFVYTETSDGFQLQSTYQVNGKPMTMQFKLR